MKVEQHGQKKILKAPPQKKEWKGKVNENKMFSALCLKKMKSKLVCGEIRRRDQGILTAGNEGESYCRYIIHETQSTKGNLQSESEYKDE